MCLEITAKGVVAVANCRQEAYRNLWHILIWNLKPIWNAFSTQMLARNFISIYLKEVGSILFEDNGIIMANNEGLSKIFHNNILIISTDSIAISLQSEICSLLLCHRVLLKVPDGLPSGCCHLFCSSLFLPPYPFISIYTSPAPFLIPLSVIISSLVSPAKRIIWLGFRLQQLCFSKSEKKEGGQNAQIRSWY